MLRQALSSVGKRGLQGLRQFAAVPAVAPEVSDVLVPEPAPWTNSAAVLHGVNDMRFENFPLPDRTPSGNVRIEIKAVGICGSDVHYWRKGRIADFVLTDPMVIGHESAGTVVEVGEDVTRLKVGDRVALEPGVPCWSNPASREGRYNLDPDIRFFATPPHHGSLAQFVDHPADFCFRLPEHLTHEEGAMVEPLSVGVHAVRRAGVSPGKTVAIMGAGPIGLVTLMAVKAFGADAVAITDIKRDNLDLAMKLGADVALNPDRDAAPQEVATWMRAALPPNGPDIVIDCAGFEPTLQASIYSVIAGGKVISVGMGCDHAHLPLSTINCKEIDLMGSFRYANTYPLCLNLMASKKVDVMPLITHRFGFTPEDVAAAFDCAARSAETRAIKVMFNLP
ncbi:Sorbitol dehydrogenase [Coccomyxa sp. Obi]|nr:Sorbitol dehydrogenase [Coccomyxa sp. Obi]